MKQIFGVGTAYLTINEIQKMCEISFLLVEQKMRIKNEEAEKNETEEYVEQETVKITVAKDSAEQLRNTLNEIIDKL